MGRIKNMQAMMENNLVDALIIKSKANKKYLGGLTGSGVTLLITKNSQYQIMDARYTDEAEQNTKGFENIDYKGKFYLTISDILKKEKLQTLGLEASQTLAKDYIEYQKIAKNIVLLGSEIESVRAVKDKDEIEKVRKACELTDYIFGQVIKDIKVGITELEIAAKINYLAMIGGASGMSFDTIVASGYRSAMPHGRPTQKKLEKGDAVVLDFGVVLDGYQSDMTRTIFVEEAPDKMREIYEIVKEAQRRGVVAVRENEIAKNVDFIARDYITSKGFGEYFGHGLGHGIGMGGDLPILNSKSETILKEGMIMSVEPGIYISGLGGVRIEDDVAIINGIGVPLNTTSKDLMIIK